MSEKTNTKSYANGFERIIQSFSFLIPVKKYSADVDYTKKVTVPAILEAALGIIGCLDQISPSELQDYFGLNDIERESLIEMIELSGFANINQQGFLSQTIRMRTMRLEHEGKITLDEVDNHFGGFTVDLLTNYIQPMADDDPIRGLHVIQPDERELKMDPQEILTTQFPRFQQCSRRMDFQTLSSKLYRINRCEYNQISSMPISIDIILKNDSFGNPYTESRIFGYSIDNEQLVTASGLIPKIHNYLNQRQKPFEEITLEDYCNIQDDITLKGYINDGSLDFKKLLQEEISQEDPLTTLLVGPCYLEKNKQIILDWLDTHIKTNTKDLPLMLWMPGHDYLWGSSLRLKTFAREMDEFLKKYRSQLVLLFPGIEKNDEREFKDRFRNLVNYSVIINEALPLSNIEILLLDNDPGIAIVQYHVFVKKELGVGGFSLPIGYITQNQEIISFLKRQLRLWANNYSSIKPIIEYRGQGTFNTDQLLSSTFDKIKKFFDRDK